MLNFFSTRELSIGIWLIIFITCILLYKPTRKCVIDLFKTVISIQLSLPFFFMIAYSVGITYLFYCTSFWKVLFIKDIVLWVVFVGTPLFFGAINKKSEEHYFRKAIISNFKLTVLMEFFVSSFTFSLVWEIILIPVLVFIFMLDAIAATKSEYRPAKKLISAIIIIINIVFIYEIVSIAKSRLGTLNALDTMISLLIPIVFSVLYIPISYIFTVFCKYQIIFIRMGFKEPKDDIKVKILHRFKTIWICKLSLSNLDKFEMSYIQHMYVSMNEVEFDKLIQQLKGSTKNLLVNQHTKEERKLINQLKEDNFHKIIEYMNTNVGIFTLLFTLVLGATSILLKVFIYAFTCGKFDYWGISHTYINFSNENMLYEILLFTAGSIIYIALNFIPYVILTTKKPLYTRLFNIIILLTCTTACLFAFFLYIEMTTNSKYMFNLQLVIQLVNGSLILTGMGYILGIMMSFTFKPQNDKSKNGENILFHGLISFPTFFSLMFGISLCVWMAFGYGGEKALDQKSFKTIDNNHIVIYEDVEYFIVSNYEVINGDTLVIDSLIQKLIKKENIETETKIFNKVKRKIDT